MESGLLPFISQEYLSEYQNMHKAICVELNKMIWNIAFLKKAVDSQENSATNRNSFIIGHLYNDEFELLILRLHKTLFDEGNDVMTLPRLRDNLFSKYLLSEHKRDLSETLKNNSWDSYEIVAARRRLEQSIPIFRTKYIAHMLIGEIDDISTSLIDIEKVVMSACELFEKLSFNVECFYVGKEKFYLNLKSEKIDTENFYEEFFLFQQTSAWCIKKIDCSYKEDIQSELVRKKISRINSIFQNI